MPNPVIPSERGHDHIPVAEVDRVPLRAVISPIPTLFMLTRDALQGGKRLGTPRTWREATLSHIRARDAETFAPLSDPETMGWPSLLDEVGEGHESIDQALERIAAIPGDALAESLETDRDVTVTAAWNPLRRDPAQWLSDYVQALHHSWLGLEPLWQRSSALLEHEIERIDANVDRSVSHAQILNEIAPSSVLGEHEWLFPAQPDPRRLWMRADGVTVVPMITTPTKCILSSPDDSIAHLAYPLPNVWRAFDGRVPPPASLEALLGAKRAAMLYRLDQPLTPSRLAEMLRMAPSAITFHLRALEAAGLAFREPRGRNVLVHRTARATTLLALYELP